MRARDAPRGEDRSLLCRALRLARGVLSNEPFI